MLKEDDYTANSHIELLESTLDLYDMAKEKVLCLSGDNCSVNQSLATKWEVPLVGCYSYSLNVAVKSRVGCEGLEFRRRRV
jgi:hypothetical protein